MEVGLKWDIWVIKKTEDFQNNHDIGLVIAQTQREQNDGYTV